jgi:hypothetical protein
MDLGTVVPAAEQCGGELGQAATENGKKENRKPEMKNGEPKTENRVWKSESLASVVACGRSYFFNFGFPFFIDFENEDAREELSFSRASFVSRNGLAPGHGNGGRHGPGGTDGYRGIIDRHGAGVAAARAAADAAAGRAPAAALKDEGALPAAAAGGKLCRYQD